MRWYIHGVWSYRTTNRKDPASNVRGVVMDRYRDEPRLFASEHAAKEYARLSLFKDAKIEVFKQ